MGLSKKACESSVMGVYLGLLIAQKSADLVLEFVEVNRLFDQNGTANGNEIFQQSR